MPLLLLPLIVPAAFCADSVPVTSGAIAESGGALGSWADVPVADPDARTHGTLHLWGQLQTWVTVHDQDVDPQADPATYGDPELDPGFTVARARLGIDGFVPMGSVPGRHQVDYALSVGIASRFDVLSDQEDDLQMVDAFGRWALPWSVGTSSLSAGFQRVPFGREAMMSSANLVFQERSVSTTWLTPGREAGVQASQSVALGSEPDGPSVLLRAGLFNGSGDVFGDDDPGLMIASRLEFILGDAYRTWSADLEPALGVGAAILANDERATNTTSWEVDGLARYSVVSVFGEFTRSTIDPQGSDQVEPGVAATTQRSGAMGQLSVFIPAWGDSGIEVAARASTFDDAADRDDNGDVLLVHGGLPWRSLLPAVDVGGGYIHRSETDGIDNDSVRLWVQVRPQANVALR